MPTKTTCETQTWPQAGPATNTGSGTWLRHDRPNNPASCTQTRWASGPHDKSPPQIGYHSACGWCYLGASHTQAEHAAKVARAMVVA